MSAYEGPGDDDDVIVAAVELIERTGAKSFELRYQDDSKPTIWMAVASWGTGAFAAHKVGAALTPRQAVLKLCEDVIDGGRCTHCGRVTALAVDPVDATLGGSGLLCVYTWRPNAKRFKRDCGGA